MPGRYRIVALEPSCYEKNPGIPEKWVKLAWFWPRRLRRRRL